MSAKTLPKPLIFAALLLVSPFSSVGISSSSQTRFPLTLEHDTGKTHINAVPKRIIALHPTSLEILLALGVQPVGIGGYGRMGTAPLGQPASSVPNYDDLLKLKPHHVGIESPSLEAMTALKPDLILSIDFTAQNVYPQFSRIAPTLVYHYAARGGWEKGLRDMGRLLGKEAAVRAVLSDIERKARVSRGQLAPILAGGNRMTVVALRGPQLLLTGPTFAPAGVLERLGFRNTAAANAPTFAPASPESLTTLKADHAFVLSFGAPQETLESTVTVLKRGAFKGVYVIDILNASRSGLGPLSEPQLMDAFRKAVLGK